MNWRRKAEQVGQAVPVSRLHPAVLRWLRRRAWSGPWCVALSGGADSTTLLLLLWHHWPDRRGDLVALHFNHRLRGAAADRDEAFCRRLCGELGISFRAGRWRRPPKDASEATAREARLAFFQRELKRAGGRVLWLAHQRDDIAETLLMRLARGSGAAGLSAPRPVQEIEGAGWRLRPLLGIAREEIEAALESAHVPWRRDVTNAGRKHFRNRIRHDVMPAWSESAGRDAMAGAALTRELLEEDDAALERWATESRALRGPVLDLAQCRRLPRGVLRRLLHRWLLAVKVQSDLSRAGFSRLLDAIEEGADTRQSLGTGFALLAHGKLKFQGATEHVISARDSTRRAG